MFLNIIDKICAWLIYVESFALPIMVMYCISSIENANWIIGFTVGIVFSWWFQSIVMKQFRLIIYSVTTLLSITSIAVIFWLSRNM